MQPLGLSLHALFFFSFFFSRFSFFSVRASSPLVSPCINFWRCRKLAWEPSIEKWEHGEVDEASRENEIMISLRGTKMQIEWEFKVSLKSHNSDYSFHVPVMFTCGGCGENISKKQSGALDLYLDDRRHLQTRAEPFGRASSPASRYFVQLSQTNWSRIPQFVWIFIIWSDGRVVSLPSRSDCHILFVWPVLLHSSYSASVVSSLMVPGFPSCYQHFIWTLVIPLPVDYFLEATENTLMQEPSGWKYRKGGFN